MHVDCVGLVWRNGPDKITDRPKGIGNWQIQHFYDAVLIRLDGEVVEAPAHSCMFFPPRHPQWFKAAGACFSDDWLGVSGGVEACCRHYHVPIARPFAVANPNELERSWREIHREWSQRPPFAQEAFDDLMRGLIRLMARGMRAAHDDADNQRREAILDLRERLRRACHETWTVAAMAGEIGLSQSRFSICYKQICGESPQRDLTAFRMQRAMQLLLDKQHSVADTAELCGFDDPLYFSRVFRRYYGRAPSTVAL